MSTSGDAKAQNEVDAVRWVPLAEARTLLTHDRDRQIVDGAA
jgi:predicted NUDIX family NTP pyrophosphohydrolase